MGHVNASRKTSPSVGEGFGAQPAHPIDLAGFLPYVIHKLWAATASSRSLSLTDGRELRTREWRVLMILAARGPLTSAEVAIHCSMDTGSTARAVRSLQEHGLITARTPRADRRKQVLALTGAGASIHDEVAGKRMEYSEDLLSCLNAKERIQLFELLDRIQGQADLKRGADGLWVEDSDS